MSTAQSPLTPPAIPLTTGIHNPIPIMISTNNINGASDNMDPHYSEFPMSNINSSDRERVPDNQPISPTSEHQPNMIDQNFMPDMNHPLSGHMPPGIRCPPPGPHGPPMLGDMRGPFPPNHHPHFPPDRHPMGHPPPNFGARHNGPPPPFRGPPPPHLFSGPRLMANMPRGNGRGRGGGQVCKFFQQGHCRHGNTCNFLHPGYQMSPGWL